MSCTAFGRIGTSAWLALYSTGWWNLSLIVNGGSDVVAAAVAVVGD